MTCAIGPSQERSLVLWRAVGAVGQGAVTSGPVRASLGPGFRLFLFWRIGSEENRVKKPCFQARSRSSAG